MLGVNFSWFFFPFPLLSGWISNPREGEAAPSNSGTCILTLVFMHFDPFIAGRKMPFFVPLQIGGNIGQFGVNFSKF